MPDRSTVSTRRFQLTTRRTGRKRIVKVAVYDTQNLMQTACARESTRRWGFPEPEDITNAGAVTIYPYVWHDEDLRDHIVSIYLSREQLDLTTIMHEAVHAALFLYSVDCVKQTHKARRHVNGWNERLAYLASEIYSAIIWKFDIIPIETVATAGRDIPGL
jgi:hypothetical protein